jgi:hypothetical protein
MVSALVVHSRNPNFSFAFCSMNAMVARQGRGCEQGNETKGLRMEDEMNEAPQRT